MENVPVVYIVDDDPDLCDSVAWLLDSACIESVVCHSAAEFLGRFDRTRPACMVLDVRMPEMSGPRLQEKLTDMAPYVSIIFVSAHGDIRMSVDTIKAGAQDFLEKPYDPQKLLDAVQLGVENAQGNFEHYRRKADVARKVEMLTPREREVIAMVVEGLPSKSIGRRLGMSVKTVDVHRTRIKTKTGAESIGTFVRDILRYGTPL
ncbi:response regulator transcription factor [Corynebacterium sp. AOP40-9SA-29]|uniref:response regulator transcription factor n=1 Tax=Corynebacterium sp. AOP40-9SA-29 TaxID=3457677 RepID=UPI004034766C